MGNGIEKFMVEPVGPDLEPLGVAGGAEKPRFATESDQELGPAVVAADAGEAALQEAAIEELLHRPPCGAPEPAVSGLELLLVHSLEVFEVIVDEAVEGALAGPARLVDAERRAAGW
jgi:hypothetical protein